MSEDSLYQATIHSDNISFKKSHPMIRKSTTSSYLFHHPTPRINNCM